MFCGHCGKELEEGAKFCPYCGAAINSKEETPLRKRNHNKKKKTVRFILIVAVIVTAVAVGMGAAASKMDFWKFADKETEAVKAEFSEAIETEQGNEESETDSTLNQYDSEAEDFEKKDESLSQMWGEYARLVKAYADMYDVRKSVSDYDENYESYEEQYPDFAFVNVEYTLAILYSDENRPAFILYDMNQDEIPELFIGIDNGYGNAIGIYDVYTFQNGFAEQLMSGIGYKAGSCILCENGIIRDESSGSAFSGSVKFHTLPENSTQLETLEEISYSGDMSMIQNWHEIENYREVSEEEREITETEFRRIRNSYKEIQIGSYESTEENIEKLKNGELPVLMGEIVENKEFIFQESDCRYLTEEDLQGLSQDECRIARNEIFARHGRRFQDQDLQEYFDSCGWYEGTIDGEDFDDSILNEYEVFNRDLIVTYEEEMGYR